MAESWYRWRWWKVTDSAQCQVVASGSQSSQKYIYSPISGKGSNKKRQWNFPKMALKMYPQNAPQMTPQTDPQTDPKTAFQTAPHSISPRLLPRWLPRWLLWLHPRWSKVAPLVPGNSHYGSLDSSPDSSPDGSLYLCQRRERRMLISVVKT